MVWCGVVWCSVVWFGVVKCGKVWCGVVWFDVIWCGVMWCGEVPFKAQDQPVDLSLMSLQLSSSPMLEKRLLRSSWVMLWGR